jgi:hypothetical protein
MTRHHSFVSVFFDRLVLQHPVVIILCVLAVVCILATQAGNFRLDASAETLVLENDEDLRYARQISSRYGQNDFLVLTYSPRGRLFSPDTLSTLAGLRDELSSLEHVASVRSILDIPLLESHSVSLKDLSADLPTLESPGIDVNQAGIELGDSPFCRDLLLSSDSRTTALLINFPDDEVYDELVENLSALRQKKASGSITPAELSELNLAEERLQEHRDKMRLQRHRDIAAIRAIMDNYRRDADLFLGGVSMIADDMISFIRNDLKVFGVGVLLFMILMLGVIFRRIRWICLPVLCCALSIACMIGVLGWLGWKVTVISSNFVSLQLIMTMSLVIHLIVRYRELSAERPQESNRRIILETMRTKLVPSVYAFLTTIVGFASLIFCNILPVIMFGKMMIVGLSVSLVVTFLVFPAVLVLMPKTLPQSKRKWRFPITTVMAGFIEASGALVLVIGAVVFVLSVVGMSRLEVENCFIDYFKENTEIHRGMKVIDQYLGGTTPLDVILDFEGSRPPEKEAEQVTAEDGAEFDEFAEFDEAAKHKKYWFTTEKMDRIKAIHGYLDGLPETGKVMSLATLLSIAEKVNEGKPLDNLELALLYNEIPDELKNLLVKPFVSEEHNQVRLWARVRDSDKSLRRNELLKRIETELPSRFGLDKQSVHLSGMLVLYNNMLQSLFSSQILTFGMTLLVLMGTYLVEFRSVKIAVIAIIPNALPIAIVLGTMGWLNVPLDMMTITIAAIGLGISDDFTIHYIHRFKDEFQIDRKYVPAMHRSHRSIGYAMFYTSITIILGFSILALSNFIPTVYFGLLTCLAMTIAILDALTILPELLILIKPFGKEA